MNAIELLKFDHQEVKHLFEKFHRSAERGVAKQQIAQAIIRELTLHTLVEEDIFYPAVRATNDEKLRELVDESIEEHRSVKEMMAEMDEVELPDEELSDQMAMLQEDVEHHVEEEETEMFPRLQKIWEEAYLNRLGQGMWERKQERKAA